MFKWVDQLVCNTLQKNLKNKEIKYKIASIKKIDVNIKILIYKEMCWREFMRICDSKNTGKQAVAMGLL